ncbi:MAG: hypothetical protein GXP58_11310 [Deltaproteobacteria bacterium]|nr:hypothetical protein [Deltaproteobacteria bacterium]
MAELTFQTEAEKRFTPFLDELLGTSREKIHSVQVTGSALTEDYDPKRSDINSVVVLKEMDLKFLRVLAPLGKKYGKKGVAAPLIMTQDYIRASLDVFPVEFLNIHWVHRTLFGDNPFAEIEVKPSDLRQQCERELKVRLIGMRQNYLSASGDLKILAEGFVKAFSGYIPLFRGILFLLGQGIPPAGMAAVLAGMEDKTGQSMETFREILAARQGKKKFSMDELHLLFENCYTTVETLGRMIDEIPV